MQHSAFYRHAFLRHVPQRYAVMLDPATVQQRGQKYHERAGTITDSMIRQHLTGQITLAAPAAMDGLAHLLPLDLDAGGLPALRALLTAAAQRGLWAFGQFCQRMGRNAQDQRGYVWVPFAENAPAAQLQLLGEQIINDLDTPAQVEARAHAAVTRLPLGKHTHTQRFGTLLLNDQAIPIDPDPHHALALLQVAYCENPVVALPPLPADAPPPMRASVPMMNTRDGITIDGYNADHDLVTLLESYGARPARGSQRLLYCPGHPDERRASLLLWRAPTGKLFCRCLSQHHNCPLAGQMRDPFGVYCALEHLDPAHALRRLNSREERTARC